MKRIILFILLSISINIYSQVKSFDFGIKTGGGLSLMIGSALKNTSLSYGYTNGFSFVSNFQKSFFLQTELLIERKTTKFVQEHRNSSGAIVYERQAIVGIDAIELYIMPGYMTKGKTKLLLSAGFFGGLIINYHSALLPSDQFKIKEVSNSPITQFDFGLSASIGVQHPITEELILLLKTGLI